MRNASTTSDAAPKAWTRPELVRLGKISDVAGSQVAGPQAAGAKS